MVTTPQAQVVQKTATNCVRLAGAVLSHVRPYAQQVQPKTSTRAQDAFFALKPAVFQKMTNMADFWEYYVSRAEQGDMTLDSAVVQYHQRFLSRGETFKPVSKPADDGHA